MIEDGLWERIEPLLPVSERGHRHPGRQRLENRKVPCGILFVPYIGIRWEYLLQELGFGSGITCRRRLRDWNGAAVWQRLHECCSQSSDSPGGWISPVPPSAPATCGR